MKLNYDVLKTLGQIVIPSIITCVNSILIAIGCENADVINTILIALLTCYNSIIVIWNANYYKEQASQILDDGNGAG